MVHLAVVELVFPHIVAQSGLGLLHRTDGAENVAVHLAAPIVLAAAVLAPVGHVVAVLHQHDEVAALQLHRLHNAAEQLLHSGIVLQRGVPQGHEQLVLLPIGHLGRLKLHGQQVFAQLARQGLAQHPQKHLPLVLAEHGQGLVELGDNVFELVDIAAPDGADGVALILKAAANFADFFLIHGGILLLTGCLSPCLGWGNLV